MVRADAELQGISIIGISGMGDELNYFYDKGREEHFKPDAFFRKPVDKKRLVDKINELLGR